MLDKVNIHDIVAIAKEAGNAIMKIYKQDFEVEYKKNSSPLTLADMEANNIIVDGLNKLSVNLPILSEEGNEIPYKDRKHWNYFWLVDPLDGTKEFVKKNDEFTINIALINKDMPVLGVIYAPALGVCYWAKQHKGAFKDGKKLPLKAASKSNTYKIVVSRSHMSDETQDFIDSINTNKEKKLISVGSSLKICLVAEGQANIYPRLGPTMEWDTAAAHIIALESLASFKKYKKGIYFEHLYNKKNLLNDYFVVTSNG